MKKPIKGCIRCGYRKPNPGIQSGVFAVDYFIVLQTPPQFITPQILVPDALTSG